MSKLSEARIAANIAQTLRSIIVEQFEGSRDYFRVLGYVKNPGHNDLLSLYEAGDIAKRVVDAYPAACWRNPPRVTDDPEAKDETPFEKTFGTLAKKFKMFHVIKRADRLANIHKFSIILIGTAGEDRPEDPLGRGRLLYLQPFGANVVNLQLGGDPKSDRFGLPEFYNISPSRENSQSIRVHHSRVIHVAEDTLDDEVYGHARLANVYNKLVDLSFKLTGGAAEMFWRNARTGLHIDIDPEVTITDAMETQYNEKIDDYHNGLRRFLLTQGGKVSSPQGQAPDPKGAFDCMIQLISGATGIPARKLVGSERGQLASEDDETSWNDRVAERQEQFCEPSILMPLVEALVTMGELRAKGEPQVVWEDLTEPTAGDKADLGLKLAQGAEIMSPGAPQIVLGGGEWRQAVGYDPELPEQDPEFDLDEGLFEDDAQGDPPAEAEADPEAAA